MTTRESQVICDGSASGPATPLGQVSQLRAARLHAHREPWSCAVAGPCPACFARVPRGRRHGLTLVELMIAMTASAVVFLAALRAFQQGRFVSTHIDREMTQAASMYDLRQLLASDVGGSFVLESPEEAGAWVGGPDSMRFLAVRPQGRPVEIEYRFERPKPASESAGQIVRSTRFCSGSTPIGPWERTVVAEGVTAFALRYGATAEGTDALAWVTEFRGERAGPRAVEVHIARANPESKEPEQHRWVIAARAHTSAAGGAP